MAHQRRYFPSGRPYVISNRLAEGLPFVANLYVNLVLFGIVARACFRHKTITVCAFLFLANHYHMLIVLRGDPNELRSFMNYIDGEIAKIVVRWLGKRNYKVWAQRYCAPILLTWEAAFEQMVYLFANPIEAHLAANAGAWTGCSSFYALFDPIPRVYKWIRPSLIPLLPNGRFNKSLQRLLVKEISTLDAPCYRLPIDPFAWMDCFPETKFGSREEMKARLLAALEKKASSCATQRRKEKKSLADPEFLAEQNPHRHYKPKKFGRRVFCISTCAELRCEFIALFKDLCKKAEAAWYAATTELSEYWVPHGMFSPPRPAFGSIISIAGFF